MNELTVTGKQLFMGREIPVVLGGFGPGKKSICDKTIADIHGMQPKHVRENISNNIKRFHEGVDFADLAQRVGDTDTSGIAIQLGYSKQAITQAEHIYILSERGYTKLIKIMETDLAWSIHDQLMDEYFAMRDHIENGTPLQHSPKSVLSEKAAADRAEAMKRNAADKNVKFMMDLYRQAGIDPKYQLVAASKMFDDAGITAPLIGVEVDEHTYDCTEMATEMGVMSKSGKPHSHAISAVLSEVNVQPSECVRAPYSNKHSGDYLRYKESVFNRIRDWFESCGYPTKFTASNGQTYTISYRGVV